MDIESLYRDFSVEIAPSGHKHTQPGWINTICPYCVGNPGYHLGYNFDGDYYFCWRCGHHPVIKTLADILHKDYKEVRDIISHYGVTLTKSENAKKVKVGAKELKYPSGTGTLSKAHIRYLLNRKFDPDHLAQIWDLRGTGPISELDKRDYKNRILIPYYWDRKIVSFDTRSISLHGSDKQRYKACPKEYEIIEHKNILYGRQEYWTEIGICLEGPTDVWRFGPKTFAVSGIEYTPYQVRVISKQGFKRLFIVFDGGLDNPQAQVQANKLAADLRFRGLKTEVVDIGHGDPGGMDQDEANHFIKSLLTKSY